MTLIRSSYNDIEERSLLFDQEGILDECPSRNEQTTIVQKWPHHQYKDKCASPKMKWVVTIQTIYAGVNNAYNNEPQIPRKSIRKFSCANCIERGTNTGATFEEILN